MILQWPDPVIGSFEIDIGDISYIPEECEVTHALGR